MPILSSAPVTIPYADIPYDKLGIALEIEPLWEPTQIEARISIRATPYRELPDGTIDALHERAWGWESGRVFADAEQDPVLAQHAVALMTVIQQFMAAKGV